MLKPTRTTDLAAWALEEANAKIRREGYPSTASVTAPRAVGCEWCDKTTIMVSVFYTPISPDTPTHIRGFCTYGIGHVYQDSAWGDQSDWSICPECRRAGK